VTSSAAAAKLRRLFNFYLLFYMVEEPSPTSSLVALFYFNPRRQLHPLSPTSTLVAANFNPCRLSISKPRRFSISPLLLDGRGVVDAAAAR
jgi:hypothetical protein